MSILYNAGSGEWKTNKGFPKPNQCSYARLATSIKLTHSVSDTDMSSLSIYYDVGSKMPFRISAIQNSLSGTLVADDQSTTKTRDLTRRVAYRSNGCTCQDLTCGCCAGFNIQQFNFNREGNYTIKDH